MKPFPHQIEAAVFLAERRYALLGSDPRTGKTGAAIMAADYALDQTILVVTTASGRAVWRKAFADWQAIPRSVETMYEPVDTKADVVIVGWAQVYEPPFIVRLRRRRWDRVIPDEGHYATRFSAMRTQALYGTPFDDGETLNSTRSLLGACDGMWELTGTPIPNSPFDAYPRLRALWPERLLANPARGWPDVTKETAFRDRYCVVKWKKVGNFRKQLVIVEGRNEAELAARSEGVMLRRTQTDVGIGEPIYDILPLRFSERQRAVFEKDVDAAKILAAAEADDTKSLEMHMGPLRRLTGTLKAELVAEAVADEFDGGLDRIVLAYWHKDVRDVLTQNLSKYGVTGIDGATSDRDRADATRDFARAGGPRVFLAQIEAAGEAIDLSASAVLWVVEPTFSPRQMRQVSLRITNLNQPRQAFVRACVLENSIDEALQTVLLRKWTSIREVLKPC